MISYLLGSCIMGTDDGNPVLGDASLHGTGTSNLKRTATGSCHVPAVSLLAVMLRSCSVSACCVASKFWGLDIRSHRLIADESDGTTFGQLPLVRRDVIS